jgi:hypothetical protein
MRDDRCRGLRRPTILKTKPTRALETIRMQGPARRAWNSAQRSCVASDSGGTESEAGQVI